MTQGHGWKDKIAAGFTNSGSRSGDKLATLIQLALFAARHGMHWINLGLPPANHSSTGSEPEMNGRGFWLGAGAQSDTDQGPDVAPPDRGRAVLEAGVRDTVAVLEPATHRTAHWPAASQTEGLEPTGPTLVLRQRKTSRGR